MKKYLTLLDVISFVLIAIGIFGFGFGVGRDSMKKEAVKMGKAEFFIGEKYRREWRWKP